jgi:hypothetical protein
MQYVRFEVLTAVTAKITAIWDVTYHIPEDSNLWKRSCLLLHNNYGHAESISVLRTTDSVNRLLLL